MTEYDPPGITNPENVDGLTHQQIKDAFDVIQNATHDMVINWGQAQAHWQESTTALLRAVRSAVDGNWTGATADQAITSIARYADHAEELVDLFNQTGTVVSSTATIAVMAKAFIPPVVQVTADQKNDPAEYDRQKREADTAQAEARRIMQERYIVGFMDQDSKLPTYPSAVSPIADAPGVDSNAGINPSSVPDASAGSTPDGAPQQEQPSSDAPQQDSPEQTQPSNTTEQPSTNQSQTGSDGSRPDSTRSASTAPMTETPTATPSSRPDIATPGTTTGTGARPDLTTGGSPIGTGGNPTGRTPSPGVTRSPVPGTQPGLTPAAASGTSGTTASRSGAPGVMSPGAARGKDDEREKKEKRVDLHHPEHVTELLGKNKYVPPVIGE